jgi:hypothetical protein
MMRSDAHIIGDETGTAKPAVLVNGANGQEFQLAILPGATPRSILERLGFPSDVVLTSARGGEAYGNEENLYPSLQPGAMLYATLPAEAGGR